MNNTRISTILQMITLLFLIIIGYLIFDSNMNWKTVASELTKAKEALRISEHRAIEAKRQLENAKKEFEQIKAQKELIIHRRDSLILVFKRKNAKNWEDLQDVKDAIQRTNDSLTKDRSVLDSLFGITP